MHNVHTVHDSTCIMRNCIDCYIATETAAAQEPHLISKFSALTTKASQMHQLVVQ